MKGMKCGNKSAQKLISELRKKIVDCLIYGEKKYQEMNEKVNVNKIMTMKEM